MLLHQDSDVLVSCRATGPANTKLAVNHVVIPCMMHMQAAQQSYKLMRSKHVGATGLASKPQLRDIVVECRSRLVTGVTATVFATRMTNLTNLTNLTMSGLCLRCPPWTQLIGARLEKSLLAGIGLTFHRYSYIIEISLVFASFDNILFFALAAIAIGLFCILLLVLYRFRSVRIQWSRFVRDQCLRCGYSIKHCDVCPECGTIRLTQRSPRYVTTSFVILMLISAICITLWATFHPASAIMSLAPMRVITKFLPPTVPATSQLGQDLVSKIRRPSGWAQQEADYVIEWAVNVLEKNSSDITNTIALQLLASARRSENMISFESHPSPGLMDWLAPLPRSSRLDTQIVPLCDRHAERISTAIFAKLQMKDVTTMAYGPAVLALLKSNSSDVAFSVIKGIATERFDLGNFVGNCSPMWSVTCVEAMQSEALSEPIRSSAFELFLLSADFTNSNNIRELLVLACDERDPLASRAFEIAMRYPRLDSSSVAIEASLLSAETTDPECRRILDILSNTNRRRMR